MGRKIDLTGHKFGRLTVLKESEHRDLDGNIYWVCKCDCGNIKNIISRSLRTGRTISCGCYNLENNQKRLGQHKYNQTHGKSDTRLYYVYKTMKNRCYNPKIPKYKNYGARGIKVCDEWKNSFQAFYDWAISTGYDENAKYGECTIERKDVNGDYCPENCCWIPASEQAKNKTTTHRKI